MVFVPCLIFSKMCFGGKAGVRMMVVFVLYGIISSMTCVCFGGKASVRREKMVTHGVTVTTPTLGRHQNLPHILYDDEDDEDDDEYEDDDGIFGIFLFFPCIIFNGGNYHDDIDDKNNV